MLTIFISSRKQIIETVDGSRMTVCETFVKKDGEFRCIQDCERFPDLRGIEVAVRKRFRSKKLNLTKETERAIVTFLRQYHAQQNTDFDCYSFVNLVKGIESHKVRHMLKFWSVRTKWFRSSTGEIVFLTNGRNSFYHAAICIGQGLYISVYGIEGALEVSTLKDMERDFGAKRILKATPRNT